MNGYPNGKVLVVGGGGNISLSSAELYDPATGTWTATGALSTVRELHTATLLPNGKVLVAAGTIWRLDDSHSYLSSAELYDPTAWIPTPVSIAIPSRATNKAFQFAFAGNPNGTNTVLTTTNSALPAANWPVLRVVPEVSSGLYLFTDSQVTNHPKCFYRIRSP